MKKNNKLFWFLMLLFFSVACFWVSCFRLEPDYFWHIKAGDYMFHHGVLAHDVFSWFTSGKYWMSHEWLFDVIIYSLKALFGNYHILVYCLICSLCLCFLVYYPNRDSFQKNLSYSLIYIGFLAIMMIFFMQARPHLISFSLLALTIWFLTDLYRNENSKKIYFLPLVSIIWANAHGGSSNLPYLLCLAFIVGGLFNFQFKKIEAKRLHKRQFIKYAIAMILCMIAVNINVHGFRMFIYPYQNMLDKTMIEAISEWQVSSLQIPSHYVFYAFLLFLVGTLLFSSKKIQWMDFLLLGFVVFLGLKSIRFWSYSVIIMSYIIFDYVKEEEVQKGAYVGITIFSLFLLGFMIIGHSRYIPNAYYYALDEETISVLKKEKPKRLFNLYNYGGELVYYDIPVFIDGRADLYSPHNFKDYLKIQDFEGGCIPIIEKYNFDFFLIDRGVPIYNYLAYNDKFELIYAKNETYLYKKIVN